MKQLIASAFCMLAFVELAEAAVDRPVRTFKAAFQYVPNADNKGIDLLNVTGWTDKLFGYYRYRINEKTGNIVTTMLLTNGRSRPTDPAHQFMCAEMTFLSNQDPLLRVRHSWRIPSTRGGRQEGTAGKDVPPEIWKRATHVDLVNGWCAGVEGGPGVISFSQFY